MSPIHGKVEALLCSIVEGMMPDAPVARQTAALISPRLENKDDSLGGSARVRRARLLAKNKSFIAVECDPPRELRAAPWLLFGSRR